MPVTPEIHRSFASRDSAFRYLASRGFLSTPRGWANGRWQAAIELRAGQYEVAIHLALAAAA